LTETLFETPAYRWVPWRAFEAFEREFEAARVALDAAKADVLEQYDAVREEVCDAFLQLADDSARRLEATGHAIPDGFREAVVRGVQGAIPGPGDLQDRLALHFRVGVILLGSEMLAEQRKAREERRRLEEAESGLQLERARELARWFRMMNWQSDAELEGLIGELEQLAQRPSSKRKRDPGPIDQVLGDIVSLCYADARALAAPSRMAALEL